ncbi:HAD domain-containing protein [Streptomyces sp. NPDC054841]
MKPLLLIDIDGPLNPYGGKPQSRPEGYTTHRMRPSGWTHDKPLRVWLNPGHGEELLALAEWYELVWATTWKGEANEWVGPHLGLPELPYIDWPVMHGASPRGTFWKTQYVLDYAAGRPFAWVDDEITHLDREWVERNHLTDALLLHIDHRIGLTRPDFDALAEWAEAL